MVMEAGLIDKGNGRFGYDAPTETAAATLEEWLEDVAGGLTVAPAPEIEPRVDGLNGGRVFHVKDASAAPGHETGYVVAWEAAEDAAAPLREALFTMDLFELAPEGAPRQFAGYTRGETWNGWACPYFTHEQALSLVEGWHSLGAEAGFNPGTGEFFFAAVDDPATELEHYAAIEIEGKKLFPIGTFGWIWDEIPATLTEPAYERN